MKTRIKEFRARKNLTQAELAEKIDVTRQTILYIERGEYYPSLLLAFKLGKVLKCNIEELFIPDLGELK
ncbi:MAG: helix-turn-helix transcriptional regulator [Nanoarchaeota archaeon]|nr:helix-turn-helix transcriptional regulator [Nanoarchaeota archaeon]